MECMWVSIEYLGPCTYREGGREGGGREGGRGREGGGRVKEGRERERGGKGRE